MHKKSFDFREWANFAKRALLPVCAAGVNRASKRVKRRFPPKGSFEREGLRMLLIGRHRAHTVNAHTPRHLKLGLTIAGALAATLCVLTVSLSGSQVMAVTVNGQMVGYVNDETEYASLMQNAKEKISRDNGNTELIIKENKIALAPTFVPGDEKVVEKNACNEDKLIDTLLSENAVETNVYTLNVAGQEVGKFSSLAEATDTLNSVKEEVSGGKADQSSQTDQSGQASQSSQTDPSGQANQSSTANQSSQADPSGQTDQSSPADQSIQAGQSSQSGAFQEDISIETKTEPLSVVDNLSDPETVKDKLLTGGEEEKVYEVQKGDTLTSVAEALGKSVDELTAQNPDLGKKLEVGEQIKYTVTQEPLIHYETTGVETTTEPIDFKTTQQKDPDMAWGKRETVQAGVPGERTVTRNVTRVNGEITAQEEISSEVTKEPVDEIVKVGTKLSQLGDTGGGSLGKPLTSWTFSRGISSGHTGDDLCAPEGTPIYAADAGTVIFAGQFGGYGNIVKIAHANGVETWYGHCESFTCQAGDTVARGQQIATVGDTGRATCFHLHFEVRVNGSVQEPMNWIG